MACHYYEYTVSGEGSFPTDMLRYDCAYPSGQGRDVDLISVRFRDEQAKEPYTVTLRSHKPPTGARWASFGWIVSNVRDNGRVR